MGFFGNMFGRGENGGLMNVIRCDEQDYLVWKWRPLGQEANTTSRENAIRYGSTLSVKDGEMAVFVYRTADGGFGGQDFIEGPYQDTIKTKNFPVLAGIVGMAFGGDSPFQAEVYFMNLQANNQIKFAVPYFDVFDPRQPELAVPVAVRGTITFNLTDCRNFIKLNRLVNFDLEQFKKQIKDALVKCVKSVVCNIPVKNNIPLVHLEPKIVAVNDIIQQNLSIRFKEDFGVNLKTLDISAIDIDKETQGYRTLKSLTTDFSTRSAAQQQENLLRANQQQADISFRTADAQADLNIENLQETQRINTQNMEETLRIQRQQMDAAQTMMLQEKQRAMQAETETNKLAQEAMIEETKHSMRMQTEGIAATWKAQVEEAQRSGRMRTQTAYPQANILDKSTQIMGHAANAMANAGGINLGNGNTGMNPGGMMAGMAMGNAMGQQMSGMINQVGNMMQQGMQQPPQIPQIEYFLAINGQQYGPYNMIVLQQLVQQGQLTPQTLVWKEGMPSWATAQSCSELAQLFTPLTTGNIPPIPNNGGMPPQMPPTL